MGRSEKETKQSMLFIFLRIFAPRRNRGEWATCGRGEREDTRMGWRDLPLFLRPLPGNPSQASAAFKEGCKPCLSSPVSDGQHRGSSCGYQGRFTCPLSHQVLSKWPPICSAFQLLGLLRRVLAFFRAISHGRRAVNLFFCRGHKCNAPSYFGVQQQQHQHQFGLGLAKAGIRAVQSLFPDAVG
ncbi:hypothetical protein MUK42_17647, partial [Musa troglodytarum]